MMKIKEDICSVGKRLYERHFIVAMDGNISVRVKDKIFFTPSGINKGEMTPEQIITTDLDGNVLEGQGKPSSEIAMHLEIYRQREDIQAIVHAHPPKCIALTIAKISLEDVWIPEVFLQVGKIPTASYETPGTKELAQRLGKYVRNTNAILMERHGIVTFDKDVWGAYYKVESVEHTANIVLNIQNFPQAHPMEESQLEPLKIWKKMHCN